jgi:hypothetical protein
MPLDVFLREGGAPRETKENRRQRADPPHGSPWRTAWSCAPFL